MKANDLHIPKPCTQDWTAMTGSDCRRHCGACDKPVHHLSQMSRPEAEAVVASGACVRFGVDARGNVLFRKGRLARVLAIAAAAFTTLPALASGQPDQAKEGIVERLANWATGVVAPQPVEELMGDIAMAMDRQVENKTSTTLEVKCDDGTEATIAPEQTWNTESYYGGSCTATAMGRDLSTTWSDLAVHCTLGSATLTCAPQE